jgi:hypothetical protein
MVTLAAPALGFCDSTEYPAERRPVHQEGPKKADAQVDKRLPPVYPGEEVSDGKRTIKVWSTSGPVPVSEAPEPFHRPSLKEYGMENGGVEVYEFRDRRDRRPGVVTAAPDTRNSDQRALDSDE